MTDKELEKRDKRYHESFLKRMLNNLIVGVLLFLSRLPFFVIYGISDFLYFVLRYLVKYRRKVILENLRHAFPEKSEKEIISITYRFYRHLCDLMLESVKMNGMSRKQMGKRIHFSGLEKFEEYYKEGKSVIVLGMHHNNWEWGSAFQQYARHKLLMLYNPVRGNRELEKFLLDSREKWGGRCVPVHKSARTVLELNKSGIPAILWLGADQTPPASSQFWIVFLNREAPFFSGPEKIAVRTNLPVYFHHTKKVGRGKYEVILTPLFEEPGNVQPKEILLGYVRKMEEIIWEEPWYYLWSHRRWKHTRPDGIPLIF